MSSMKSARLQSRHGANTSAGWLNRSKDCVGASYSLISSFQVHLAVGIAAGSYGFFLPREVLGTLTCYADAKADLYRVVNSSEVGRYSYSATPIGCVIPCNASSTKRELLTLHRMIPSDGLSSWWRNMRSTADR